MKVMEDYSFVLVKKIREKCLLPQEKGNVLLIHGRPGSGKSVFMSQLYNKLDKPIEYLTAIKAELLKSEDSPQKVYKLFQEVSEGDTLKVLILDSLDVLAHTKREELREWLFYVDKLKNIRNMTVVCACRTFEAEHLYPLSLQEWSEKYNLEDELNTPKFEDYIRKVLKNLNYDYESLSPEFKKFIRIPLHLEIVTKIIKKKSDPRNINTLHGIYTELLNVLGVLKNEDNLPLLVHLADRMIKSRTTWLSYTDTATRYPQIQELAETALIEIKEGGDRIKFYHQTLIDYFVALKVVNQEQSLTGFILQHKQNPFIRPTLYHILGLLRANPERLFKELKGIFFSKISGKKIGFTSLKVEIRNYIKTTILSAIGSWQNPTEREAKFLIGILKESPSKDNLTEQFLDRNPNSNWFPLLKENLILPLLQKEMEKWTIIKYLVNIAPDLPDEVLDIALNFLKEKPNSDVSWFLERISDKLHKIELENSIREKFATLLEEMVRKDFIEWYFETVVSCKRLAKINPQKAITLYLEAVEKEFLKDKSEIPRDNSLSSSYSQKEVLPPIYEGAPKNTLRELTVFFEKFFSEHYEGEKKILDEPLINLYGAERHYGLDAMYNWYKEKMLSFSYKSPEEAKELIGLLFQSQWETQKELSLLCKLQCPNAYSNDIYNRMKEMISTLKSNNLRGCYSETFINLLEKGFSILSERQRKEIISDLTSIDFADKTQYWLWGPLHHIPEQFQTKEIKNKLHKLKEKFNFGKYKYTPPFEMTGGPIVSPVPKEELKNMEPNKLLEFLIENRDLKESWQVKNGKIPGGVRELAREVSKVLTDDLKKYKKVIQTLAKDPQNDVYTAWFFASLSNKQPDKELIKWLIPIVLSIWKRESLQLDIVRYIRKIEDIITKEQFTKLKPVLIELSFAKDPEKDKFFEYRKQGYSNDALTEGINSVRGELCEVLLRLNKRFLDEDIYKALGKLAEDKTISVRASLIFHLPLSLQSWGWKKCFALFTKAFEKGPEEYSRVIIEFLRWVPKNNFGDVKPILLKLKNSGEPKLIEAYISLNVIYYFKGFVTKEAILKIMESPSFPIDIKKEGFSILVGQVKKSADLSIPIIKHLIKYKKHFKNSFYFLFLNAQPEDIEKFTSIIEETTETEPFDGDLISYIFDYLGKCILIDPVLIFERLKRMLSILKNFESQENYRLEIHKAARSEAPINIVNTILECYPEREEEALATLDRLSELHFGGTESYLKSFDRL